MLGEQFVQIGSDPESIFLDEFRLLLFLVQLLRDQVGLDVEPGARVSLPLDEVVVVELDDVLPQGVHKLQLALGGGITLAFFQGSQTKSDL